MKKFAGTLIALVVFAGLLVWVMTQERGRVPEKEELLAKEIMGAGGVVGIEAIKYDTVGAVAARKGEQQTDEKAGKDPGKRVEDRRFAIEKQGDDWCFTKPFSGFADPDKIKAMVEAIERLKPNVREDADLNTKDFGLSNPTLKVIAKLKKGKTLEITLGENTPVGAQIYAKIEGKSGLYLIPSTFTTDFQQEAEKMRDKKLARFEKDAVTGVTFVNKHGTIQAERKQKGKEAEWTITSPGPYKGDEWAISSAFGKIAEVEAKEFAAVPKNLATFGLDKPRARCTVQLKDGKTVEVLIGKSVKKQVKTSEYAETTEEKEVVYAMRQGRSEVLLVETTLFDDLNKDIMALRDNRILDFQRERVTSIRVSRKDGFNFAVMRAGDDWKLQSPEAGDAKKTKVDDILWDLSDLEAKEYLGTAVDLKKLGLVAPSTVVTIELTGKKAIKVKFGDMVDKGGEPTYYCMVDDGREVYRVGQMVINDLPAAIGDIKASPEDLKSNTPPDLSGLGITPSSPEEPTPPSGAGPSE